MATYIISASVDKRIFPFIKKGSSMKVSVEDVSTAESAMISFDLKDGVSMEMLDSLSPLLISLRFDNATSIPVEMEASLSSERKTALPHVESEYDEIKGRVSEDLGKPVQTLYPGPVSKPKQVRAEHDPARVGKAEIRQLSQFDILQNQMAAMMKQMQALQNGVQIEEATEPQEENLPPVRNDTIMTYEEFKSCLERSSKQLPDIDLNKEMTRKEALEIEKYKLG